MPAQFMMKMQAMFASTRDPFTEAASSFNRCFPIFSRIIFAPRETAILAVILSALSYPVSPILFLAIPCLWTALFAFYLERDLLGRMLFPPFTAVVCWAALGTGVGIPIMYSTSFFEYYYRVYAVSNWLAVLQQIQVVHLLAFPFAWLGYWSGGFRHIKKMRGDFSVISISHALKPKLLALGWILIAAAVLMLLVKALTGMEDRSLLSTQVGALGSTPNGALFLLNILPKFGMMGFVFAPYLWKSSRWLGRSALAILLSGYTVLALASGTRGLFLYMAVFVFVGAYLFRSKDSRWFELGLLILVAIGVIFSGIVLVYRTSDNFNQTSSNNIISRLVVLADPETYKGAQLFKPEKIYRLGFSLYALDDPYVFALTPERIPRVGFQGASAVIWTWIPTTFYPDKLPLLDAESITGLYNLPPVAKKYGYSISLAGDAYRRFGWAGIPPLAFLAYALYGLLSRWCLASWRSGSLYGWALLVFVMMFFWSRPFNTTLGTWWIFFYDVPKHLIVLLALCAVISALLKLLGIIREVPSAAVRPM